MQALTIKQKLTNYYYFVIFNSILACIIGIGYWSRVDVGIIFKFEWLDLLYIITTHFSIICLVVLAISLITLPTIYLKFKKAILIQLIFFSLLLALIVCDVRVFQTDETHIFLVTINTFINIINSKQAMFTVNKAIACTGIIVLLWMIYKINIWINKTNWLTSNKIGTKFTSLLLVSCFISLLIYQLTTKEKQHKFLVYMQYLSINKNNAITSMYKLFRYGKLQYPLKPLQTIAVTNPPNILIIAMDAWRADCFNEQDSPNLWSFSKQGKVFSNHFSGGNYTSFGLFSLFYGISSNYYNRFKQQKIPALFFSRLKQLCYQVDIFTTDICIKNFINDTQNLYINNKNTRLHVIDKQITDSWLNNYTNLDKTKPWFSFVFYDSLHGPDFPDNYSANNIPAINLRSYKKFANKVGKQGFINSYKTNVHYIDSLANKILTRLEESNDLENTIVIITADHGCEWNDNNQGQWGYWSNFTDCQVKVPLAIILPKQYQDQLKHKQDNLTTHYDIVPTLMHNFLGVANKITDYSIGNDLFSEFNNSSWNLATAIYPKKYYTEACFAIITKNQIIRVKPSSNYNFIDKFNNIIFSGKEINFEYLNQAIDMMTRFLK